jgi:serine/threonine-protein kinase
MSIIWDDYEELNILEEDLGMKFEPIEFLGEGGFGKVFKIRDTSLGRECALKVLNVNKMLEHDTASREEIKARFIREARSHARCEHPNIVTIYEFGVKGTFPYFIMKYVKGKSLRKMIAQQGKLGFDESTKISKEVLSALKYMHSINLIHRDLKPSNIMIEEGSGKAILIDFGLAKDIKDTGDLTSGASIIGTFFYMSPEQLSGEEVGPASDIYSFGVVLYEMLNGKNSASKLVHGNVKEALSELRKNNPDFPEGIENIMSIALATDPKKRYKSANKFLNAIKSMETRIGIESEEEIDPDEPIKDESIPETDMEDKATEKHGGMWQDEEDVETIVVEKVGEGEGLKSQKRLIRLLIFVFGIIAIAAFIVINPFKPNNRLDLQYREFIASANESIEKGEFEKAWNYLNNAREIKDTDEVRNLLKTTAAKQREKMANEFEELKKSLKEGVSEEEKIAKCRKFLNQHQNIPKNSQTEAMVFETNNFITQLEGEITADAQHQKHIEAIKRYIKSGDYAKAESELEKARRIKNTDEVKQLSDTITKGLEVERINGRMAYITIKNELNINKYLEFKKNYPGSIHLQDLKSRLRSIKRNLPPEKYWGQSIKRNLKGYYELEFGEENNGHLMIYIPEKSFWIDKYEVSWRQFRAYLAVEKIKFSSKKSSKYIHNGDEFPAVVTYEEAVQYCKKYGFRLPTGSEWEYAAGKEVYIYPWGNELPDAEGIYRVNYNSLKNGVEKDEFLGTAPVRSFEKFSSIFGAVNMAGNISEWVQGKILKGGSYFSYKEDLEIKKNSFGGSAKMGFRCIKKDEN